MNILKIINVPYYQKGSVINIEEDPIYNSPMLDEVEIISDYPTDDQQDYDPIHTQYEDGDRAKIKIARANLYNIRKKRNGEDDFRLSEANTKQCASFQNSFFRIIGKNITGNAWKLNGVTNLFNGYTDNEAPFVMDEYVNMNNRGRKQYREQINQWNHKAAENFKQKFNFENLNKNKSYIVNMYYDNSKYQDDAIIDNKDSVNPVFGSHTGILEYDPDNNKWVVTHNITGRVHIDYVDDIFNGNYKYGITAVFKPNDGTNKSIIQESKILRQIKPSTHLNGGLLIKQDYNPIIQQLDYFQ